MRSVPICLTAAISFAAWSCQTTEQPFFLSHEEWAQELQKRGVNPQTVPDPLQVTESMRQVAARWVGPGDPPARLERLQKALFNPDEFPFTYSSRGTLTAAEAFFRREGNCLSFTNLFVALGRSLGIPVTTAFVQKTVGSEREGDLIVVNTHVVAAMEYAGALLTYDFDRARKVKPLRVKLLDDMWITALYLNNRGADELRLGHPEVALRFFRDTVALAPDFAAGWANLGITYRRVGNIQEAFTCYRHALELEPSNPTVLSNLASLFRYLGREREAQQALRAANLAEASPHQLLVRGDLELAAGRIADARKLYRRALRLHPDFTDGLVSLARLELSLGNREKAKRLVSKALKLNPGDPTITALHEELSRRPPQ